MRAAEMSDEIGQLQDTDFVGKTGAAAGTRTRDLSLTKDEAHHA